MSGADARTVLRRRSKSFFWAGLLLPGPMLDDAAVLYAFCRLADDLADDGERDPQEARRLLAELTTDLERGSSRRPEVRAFLELCERRAMDLAVPRALLATMAQDTGPVRLASLDEVLRYAYGAAGTVGLMMCGVMGVTETAASPFAIDLGVAMQLTNIARDVHEDARRDRVYLPVDILPHALASGDAPARDAAWRGTVELLTVADAYYRSAEAGMHFIPRRPRLAIMTAARLYEAIGPRVLRAGAFTEERAVVPTTEKARLTLSAARDWLVHPRYRPGQAAPHDATLHRALAGLPGVHGVA